MGVSPNHPNLNVISIINPVRLFLEAVRLVTDANCIQAAQEKEWLGGSGDDESR